MERALGAVLAVEVAAAVSVLVYVVVEDIVTWFADRRIEALRQRSSVRRRNARPRPSSQSKR